MQIYENPQQVEIDPRIKEQIKEEIIQEVFQRPELSRAMKKMLNKDSRREMKANEEMGIQFSWVSTLFIFKSQYELSKSKIR